MTGVDAASNAAAFLHGNSFSKEMAWYAESIKQPVGSVELLTFTAVEQKAPEFTKPLMVCTSCLTAFPLLMEIRSLQVNTTPRCAMGTVLGFLHHLLWLSTFPM